MKQKKVQSLSRKLFVNFILSCLLPIVVVSFLVSYLFGITSIRRYAAGGE